MRQPFDGAEARGHTPSPWGVLPKWNGARVCDPQQPGVPNGRRKFPWVFGLLNVLRLTEPRSAGAEIDLGNSPQDAPNREDGHWSQRRNSGHSANRGT